MRHLASPDALQTPCYILDESVYRNNLRVFRNSFQHAWGGTCRFGYSVKTNHLRWPLLLAREEGFDTEVVSPDEYACVRQLGIPDTEIIYNGPQKRDTVFAALRAGALVNLDSLEECEMVARAAHQGTLTVHGLLGLRVNFDLETCCPGETTSGEAVSRFGICVENGDLSRAVSLLREAGLTVSGLHMHQSSSTRSLRVFRALSERAVRLTAELQMDNLSFIDMGGGFFGGNYFPGKPSIPEYAEVICEELKKGFDPKKTTLILEPGAGVLATAMDYLTRVLNFREIRGQTIVTLDGSLLHINPMMHPHPTPFTLLRPGPEMVSGERERWIIAGSTCMELDRFEPRDMNRRPTRDSLFLFHCCGAYMATHNSNFINAAPAIYLKQEGEYTPLRVKDPTLMSDY